MITHKIHSVKQGKMVKTPSELTAEVNSTNTALIETWLTSIDTQTALMELAVLAFFQNDLIESQKNAIELLELELDTLKNSVDDLKNTVSNENDKTEGGEVNG